MHVMWGLSCFKAYNAWRYLGPEGPPSGPDMPWHKLFSKSRNLTHVPESTVNFAKQRSHRNISIHSAISHWIAHNRNQPFPTQKTTGGTTSLPADLPVKAACRNAGVLWFGSHWGRWKTLSPHCWRPCENALLSQNCALCEYPQYCLSKYNISYNRWLSKVVLQKYDSMLVSYAR